MEFPQLTGQESITLEKLRVASRRRLGLQMAKDLTVSSHIDHVLDRMVIELHTEVMAHRLADEDVRAQFERDVEFECDAEVPGGRVRVLAPALMAGVFTILTITLGSLLAAIAVMAFALVGVAVWAATPKVVTAHETRTIRGTVTVPVASYATFPENDTVYPSSLGNVIQYQNVGEPEWNWEGRKP